MPPRPEEWADLLGFSALEANFRLPQGLLTAIVRQESAGNPRAQNVRSGAQGLFQFMPDTARAYKANPLNPLEAAPAAAEELSKLYRKYDADLERTLAGWNWGQGRVDRLGMGKAPAETRDFIAKVGGEVTARDQDEASPRPPGAASRASVTRSDPSVIDVTDFQRWLETQAPASSPDQAVVPGEMDVPPGSAPADLTIDIGGELPQAAPALVGGVPRDELNRRIDAAFVDDAATQRSGTALIPGMALETGGSMGGALAGARLGAALGPVGAVAGGIGGAILGGGGANRLGKAVGLIAPEEPWVETPVANVYTSDLLGAAGAVAPVAWQAAKAAGKTAFKVGTRAGRALTKAEQATAQQAQAALETYQAQRAAWEASEALKREAWDTDRAAEVLRTNRANAETLRQWQTREGQRVLSDAEKVALTQAAYEDAAGAMEQAFSTQSTANYKVAAAQAKQAQQAHRAALKQFDTAKAHHAAAVKRLQALPDRYEPPMPSPVARTTADVQRDIAALDQGGTAADDVLKRLETDDIFDASIKLNEEEHLLRQGAGDAIPSPYQQAGQQATPVPDTDPLLRFIRGGDVQGAKGLRLSDDDLREGWSEIISNRETGTSGLLNNRSGRSVQDAANDAFDQGLLDTPSPDELRAKLGDALAGRSTMGRQAPPPEAPAFPADAPPAARPAGRTGGPQRASAVWYQRLDDMAGTAPVDLTPAHEAAATVQQQLMDMLPSLQDPLARKVVKDLTEASTEGNVAQVHAALKALGRSTRTSSNPEHRYLLGQMAEGFQNALEYSAKLYPETSKGLALMQEAKRAWRQEHAVDELHSLFRTSGPIVTQTKSGELKMDVGKLLNRVENLIKGESPSKGSFTSRGALPLKDLMDLRVELKTFVGTPDLPTQRPTPPGPVPVHTPSRLGPPQMPRVVEPPTRTPAPSVVTPPPVEPELPAFGLTGALGRAGGVGVFGGPVAGFAFATADRLEYALSALLLSPRFRPLVLKALQPGGTIDPQILGGLAAAARQLGEIPEEEETDHAPSQRRE